MSKVEQPKYANLQLGVDDIANKNIKFGEKTIAVYCTDNYGTEPDFSHILLSELWSERVNELQNKLANFFKKSSFGVFIVGGYSRALQCYQIDDSKCTYVIFDSHGHGKGFIKKEGLKKKWLYDFQQQLT